MLNILYAFLKVNLSLKSCAREPHNSITLNVDAVFMRSIL